MNTENISKQKSFFKKMLSVKEMPVFLFLIGFCIILSILSPYFLTASNLMTTLVSFSSSGLVVIGMTIVLVMSGLDLSVGAVVGFSATVVAVLFAKASMNIWLASAIAIVTSSLCGLINGIFIAKLKLSPFIMTLAMQSLVKGLMLLITQGKSIATTGVDDAFSFLGQGYIGGFFPCLVLIFIIVAIIGHFLLRHTEPFRQVYYIGSNEKSARLSGINVDKVKIFIYILSAFLASIAGVLSTSRFGASTTSTGAGVEMTAISAAVIGGASLNGGEGSILGAVLGIMLLSIVDNGLILLKVSVYGQDLISGAILLIAVTLDAISHLKKNS